MRTTDSTYDLQVSTADYYPYRLITPTYVESVTPGNTCFSVLMNRIFHVSLKITPTNSSYTLFSYGNIVVTYNNDTLTLTRTSNSFTDSYTFDVTIPTDTESIVTIERLNNKLSVYLNSTKIKSIENFYYDIASVASALTTSNTLSGTIHYVFAELARFYPLLYNLPFGNNKERYLIDLYNRKSCSIQVLPAKTTSTYYNPALLTWVVMPANGTSNPYITNNGLFVTSHNVSISRKHTVEVVFSTASATDAVILSTNKYYLRFNTGKLYFYYLDAGVLSAPVELGVVNSGKNIVVLDFDTTAIRITLNNVLVTINASLDNISPKYLFNYNKLGVANTLPIYIYDIKVSAVNKLKHGLCPYIIDNSYKQYDVTKNKYKFHLDRGVLSPFSDGGVKLTKLSTNLTPATYVTFNIEHFRRSFSVVYAIYMYANSTTTLVNTESTSITVTGTSLSTNFNIYIPQIYADSFIKEIILGAVANKLYSSVKVPVMGYTALPTTPLLLSNMLDGYMSDTATLASLKTGSLATTTASKVTTIYGPAYRLNSYATRINLPATVNAKTFVLFYRELSNTPYRGYCGSSSTYTFNGGANGELIGDLQVIANDYVEVLNKTNNYSVLKLSLDGFILVAVNKTTNNVEIYKKTLSWNTTPQILTLDLQAPTTLNNVVCDISTSGGYIALGFPDSNSGEGVVQVWRNEISGWVKQLHLSSPSLTPLGGFGAKVCINDNGDRLLVYESGETKTHHYIKDSVWPTTPTQSITKTTNSLSAKADFTKLVITDNSNNTEIYEYISNTYTLTNTITFGLISRISKTSDLIVIADVSITTVKVYTLATLTQTLTKAEAGYGSSVSLVDSMVVVGSPTSKKIYTYDTASWSEYSLTKNYTNYGLLVSCTATSVLVGDAATRFDLFSRDSASLQSPISTVYQYDKDTNSVLTVSNKTTSLYSDDINMVVIQAGDSSTFSINQIGATKNQNYLNGLVVATFMYNINLTEDQLKALQKYVITRLKLSYYTTTGYIDGL